jgi:hypothetical protein
MTIETTRRSFIAGAPAIALVATIPGTLKAAPSALRRDWEAAMARYKAAQVKHDAYAANVFDPAWNAEKAFEEARGLVHKLPNGNWSPFYYDRRCEFQAEHGTAYCAPDEMHERMDGLADELANEAAVLLDTPAPDLAALRWKLDYLTDRGTEWGGWEGMNQPLADIARLLPPAA